MQLPGKIQLTVGRLFRQVELRGYRGKLQHVDWLETVDRGRKQVLAKAPQDLTLLADRSDPLLDLPACTINLSSGGSGLLMDISRDLRLQVGDPALGRENYLEVLTGSEGDVRLQIDASSLELEADRYLIDEIRKFAGLSEHRHVELRMGSENRLVSGEFFPLAPERTEVKAAFLMPGDVSSLPLVSERTHPKMPTFTGTIKLFRSLDPAVEIDGRRPPNVLENSPSDLTLQVEDFELASITLHREGGPWTMRVEGRGRAISVKQNQRELVPTQLEEILNSPPHEKGLWGLTAAFSLFAAAVFLRRALEQLARVSMPD